MNLKSKFGLFYMVTLLAFSSCKKADSDKSSATTNAGKKDVAQTSAVTWTTVLDGTTFSSYSALENSWGYRYPWGSDHNGSARMYGSTTDHNYVSVSGGVLTLRAQPVPATEGNSTADPYLPIRYRSGAIYAKSQVLVDANFDTWEISGDFKAPVNHGTWPAFWTTGVNTWPPECDILEFKGTTTNLQNTVDGPDWQNTAWESTTTVVSDAQSTWHNYKLVLSRIKNSSGVLTNDVRCQYYIDNVLRATHTGTNHVNQPQWIIINLQMEGASGTPGPTTDTYYYARNIIVRKGKTTDDLTSGGTYRIINRNSGKVLSPLSGSTADGVNIVQVPNSGASSQKWVFTNLGNGYWSIKNVNSNKFMDISGASTANGANNIQWTSNNGNNQQWQIVQTGSYYNIINRNSSKLLDISGSSTADNAQNIQWGANGGYNQQWQIIP